MNGAVDAGAAERLLIAKIAILFSVLAGVSLVCLVFLFDANYPIKLILWLVFSLSIFHWLFARWRGLTANQVKLIDYPYLGAAALGLLIAAVHYSDQREIYIAQYNELHFQYLERQHRERLRPHLNGYKKEACEKREEGSLLALHCQFANELEHFLSAEASAERAVENSNGIEAMLVLIAEAEKKRKSSIFDTFRQFEEASGGNHKQLGERLDSLRRQAPPNTYEQLVTSFQIVSSDVRRRAGELTRKPRDRTFFDVMLAIGFTALWPFIVLLALALRLTKVTIETRGWSA